MMAVVITVVGWILCFGFTLLVVAQTTVKVNTFNQCNKS